ncbi:MAG: peptidase M1, partial [Candidatus Sulfotelmatobacter sp.]
MILVDFPTRRFWSVCLALVAALLAAVSLSAQRAERATLDITGYVIDAELDTATHHIAAKAQVTFTAPESADEVSFGFHPALKINKITDDAGKLLTGERLADGTIRVAPSKPFAAGQANHWTFDYEGVITGNEDGPVEGLKLAAIQEPITYLLYPARWFPTAGFMTDRFTAQLHIKVPQGMKVFASGAQGTSQSVTLASGKPGDEFDFSWDKPGFPGTVIAGRYLGPFTAGPGNV